VGFWGVVVVHKTGKYGFGRGLASILAEANQSLAKIGDGCCQH